MQVRVTLEVPDMPAVIGGLHVDRLLAALSSQRSVPVTRAAMAADRIVFSSAANAPETALAALAARSHPGQHSSFVAHGALRVPAFVNREFDRAVGYLRRDSAMRAVIARVEQSRTAYTLRVLHNGADAYDPNTHVVAWDPHSALRTASGGRQSPALGLGHELAHAAASPTAYDAASSRRLRAYDDAEERRVIRGAEAHAARTLGEAQRYDHRGTAYRVASPVAV